MDAVVYRLDIWQHSFSSYQNLNLAVPRISHSCTCKSIDPLRQVEFGYESAFEKAMPKRLLMPCELGTYLDTINPGSTTMWQIDSYSITHKSVFEKLAPIFDRMVTVDRYIISGERCCPSVADPVIYPRLSWSGCLRINAAVSLSFYSVA